MHNHVHTKYTFNAALWQHAHKATTLARPARVPPVFVAKQILPSVTALRRCATSLAVVSHCDAHLAEHNELDNNAEGSVPGGREWVEAKRDREVERESRTNSVPPLTGDRATRT